MRGEVKNRGRRELAATRRSEAEGCQLTGAAHATVKYPEAQQRPARLSSQNSAQTTYIPSLLYVQSFVLPTSAVASRSQSGACELAASCRPRHAAVSSRRPPCFTSRSANATMHFFGGFGVVVRTPAAATDFSIFRIFFYLFRRFLARTRFSVTAVLGCLRAISERNFIRAAEREMRPPWSQPSPIRFRSNSSATCYRLFSFRDPFCPCRCLG